MKTLTELYKRILQRVNINLREFQFDVGPLLEGTLSFAELNNTHGFYAITSQHPLDFQFHHSNLAGSYFLGKCQTANSILYKSDIRGDELKKKGTVLHFDTFDIVLTKDEEIVIEDSLLIKTLVHNHSHDPETPEHFSISNTLSMHYANIHGSPTDGSFLGPFATVDLSTVNDCVIDMFSYVQVQEINHLHIPTGTIWVSNPDSFNFLYRYQEDAIQPYLQFTPGGPPRGIFIDCIDTYKESFAQLFETVDLAPPIPIPQGASLDRFAVIRPKTSIGENVLVAQRALLENAQLGKGANVQENCFIVDSNLKGYDVTAHGAKLFGVDLEAMVFVGFNSFLRAQHCRLHVGNGCIIMPHTIIDTTTPLQIPPRTLVWGCINDQHSLANNSISFKELCDIEEGFSRDNLVFEGSGSAFLLALQSRIQHILEANGAFYDGTHSSKGHAQKNQHIAFNIIQPYPEGENEGIYPTISIRP